MHQSTTSQWWFRVKWPHDQLTQPHPFGSSLNRTVLKVLPAQEEFIAIPASHEDADPRCVQRRRRFESSFVEWTNVRYFLFIPRLRGGGEDSVVPQWWVREPDHDHEGDDSQLNGATEGTDEGLHTSSVRFFVYYQPCQKSWYYQLWFQCSIP